MKTLQPGTFSILFVLLFFGFSSQAFAQEELLWDTLADLSFEVNDEGDWVTEFGDTVKGLEGKSVKIIGFMMPLENTLEQKHFILSMLPLDGCQFCAPGTQAQFLEVKVKGDGIRYSYDPIEVAGTFELIPDAPMGLYFLIKDAKEVK